MGDLPDLEQALGYVLVKGRIAHLDPAVIMAGQMLCAVVPLLKKG